MFKFFKYEKETPTQCVQRSDDDIMKQIFEEEQYWKDRFAKMSAEEKLDFLCTAYGIERSRELMNRLCK
jgi:hypothetical protein